jgi:hypothetical protein
MLSDFKSSFDHVTHISYSIVNINIYKYRTNLVNLKILQTLCTIDDDVCRNGFITFSPVMLQEQFAMVLYLGGL